MKLRQLGRFGPTVSAVGVGCMPMSGTYGTSSESDSIAVLHRAVELGVSLFDTADIYGQGHNEQIVGRALKGRRDRVVVATKVGGVMSRDDKWTSGFNGRPEYVKEACDASLGRLGIDVIDLYQLHRVDPETPIEDTVGAMADLVGSGKVRFIGLCEVAPSDLKRAAAVHPIATLQSEYSLIERDIEREMLGLCEHLGVGLVPYAPLGRGLLGGSITSDTKLEATDIRRSGQMPRVATENLAGNVALAQVVADIAAVYDATPAQVALAWLLSRRSWIVPIPGSGPVEYLEENVLAPDLELDPRDMRLLEGLATQVRGDRYGAEGTAQAALVSPARPTP
ncbi:MAG TPA: aldo/keto reductase [Acidimicrobiales bacterium]|jgi:aryl-alcohol dehydrogenase-like predicted oxidoreductase|nr:aldo/keto reductase [Acidimicrobiales bacterium]